MELPGLGARARRLAGLWAALAVAVLVLVPGARAASKPATTTPGPPIAAKPATTTTVADPNLPVLVTSQTKPPAGDRLTATEVERIAFAVKSIRAVVHRHRGAYPAEYTKGPGQWQVSWFTPGAGSKEIAQVYVDDATGKVTQAWTGFQVAWSMARGYPGAFGRRVNSWYVWIPMCLLFVAPFLPWRRRGGAPRVWSLLHLDLMVLLGFSVSLAFFNHARIGLSVPLVYPFLLYLLVRMLLLGFGKGVPRTSLRLAIPAPWLAVAVIFLVGFRIGLNVANSNVIDVGYAGVIGADRLLHDKPLYGGWPHDNAYGDTYGPVNYYAYVPFRALFGWSGTWDQLPAAHAAAIFFDLLTLLGLFLLGRRVRGPTLGIVLAYAWAAYPFSLYALSSNTNDALVAALLVLALLVVGRAPGRGVAGALAALTKFAPFALAPLLMRGLGAWPRRRSLIAYVIAYGLTIVAALLPVLLNHDLHAFWRDSISYQAGRIAPFSVWGLWGGLGVEQHLVQGAAAALAVAVAFVPARRGMVEVAALGAAVLIALQLGVNYWLYPYIVWFFPLVIVALFAGHPERDAPPAAARPSLHLPEAEPRQVQVV